MLKLIVVYGIPPNIMHSTDSTFGPELSTLHHHLHQVRTDDNDKTSPPLFVTVEPTKSTKDDGKWFFVTTNHTYEQAITFIDDHLPDLCDQFITEKHKNDQDKPSLIPRRPNKPSSDLRTYSDKIQKALQEDPIPFYLGSSSDNITAPPKPTIVNNQNSLTSKGISHTYAQALAGPLKKNKFIPSQTDIQALAAPLEKNKFIPYFFDMTRMPRFP